MKKSLICLAVLGVCATANAQSSVTLSGTVDLALTRGTGSLSDRTQLTSGNNATSKLIVRANEDLGDGTAAFIHLESGLLADSGTGQSSSTNNQPSGAGPAVAGGQGLTFNRRSIVGLRGAWGAVEAGRNWAPMYDAYTGKFDPFGVGVGINLAYSASITQANGAVRMSNDIGYTTPKILGGLSANIQRWFGENARGAATSNDGAGDGVRFNYDNGPIGAIVHWGRTHYAAGDATYRAAAVVYNFGPANGSLVVNNDKQGTLNTKGWLVGAWVPVGVGEIKGSYSVIRSNAGGGDQQGRKLAIGYVHNLSKRSAVYTTLARVTNKGGFRHALGGGTTAANAPSTGFDLGIRHNF